MFSVLPLFLFLLGTLLSMSRDLIGPAEKQRGLVGFPSKRASSQGFAKGMRIPLPTSNVLMDAPSLGVPWPHRTVVKPIQRVGLLVCAAEFLPMTLGQARPGQYRSSCRIGFGPSRYSHNRWGLTTAGFVGLVNSQ